MEIEWTRVALTDLERVYTFLAVVNDHAAARRYAALVDAPLRLLSNPRLGRRVDDILGREVRRIFIGAYELRYEVKADVIVVLRIWHTRENR
jgi:plasmid stabilization system protein ParE